MLTKTLIAMLVVASTTVGIAQTASAAPMRPAKIELRQSGHMGHGPVIEHGPVIQHGPVFGHGPVIEHRPDHRPDHRDDHRFERDRRFAFAPRFVTVATGPAFVDFGGLAGCEIELDATGGATFVQQVGIQYADGRTQLVPVDQEVDAQQPQLVLPTDGGAVAGVTVYGQGARLSVTAA